MGILCPTLRLDTWLLIEDGWFVPHSSIEMVSIWSRRDMPYFAVRLGNVMILQWNGDGYGYGTTFGNKMDLTQSREIMKNVVHLT